MPKLAPQHGLTLFTDDCKTHTGSNKSANRLIQVQTSLRTGSYTSGHMTAKYKRIADSLTNRIRRGEIGKGSRLPGELDLAETYEVSRSTIRQALAELQHAGLIEPWTGARSFVRYDGAYLDDQIGWAEALAR